LVIRWWVEGGAVGSGGCDGGAVEVELPAVFVDSSVVVSAEEDEVVEVGGAAVDPVRQVVGLGPGGWSVA
jgi:hypothetical protein